MDKRRTKRIVTRLPVNFGAAELAHTGITNDISESGMFIKTTKFYSPGCLLKINLLIPKNGATTFTGRVVRADRKPPFLSLVNNGVGVELVESAEDTYLTFISSIKV
jgi:hypothetical protein